ncbi:MAG: C39 family peptidase [Candidatus Sumerlaeia bacterium]|nr:C39 family peptidase [Candidatus Sumerlaeia bacterium]
MSRRFFCPLSLATMMCLSVSLAPASDAQDGATNEATTTQQEQSEPIVTNRLGHHPHMVDYTVDFGRANGPNWTDGEFTRSSETIDQFGDSILILDDDRDRFPRNGTWVSSEVETPFTFTELVPSWMLDTPEDTGIAFEFRVRDHESGDWSPWLYLGQWGRTIHWPARTIRFDHGRVNTDYILLQQPADAYQARVRLYSYDIPTKENPQLTRLSVVTSGIIADDNERARFQASNILSTADWARDIRVPFTAQRSNGPEIGGSTCSPTSVKMVMDFHGVELPAFDVAMEIYDREYGIFGNWARAVAFASSHGLDSRLTRIRDWNQVKEYIAEGQPIIASIRFEEGTFPSNPMRRTNGHLIVIRGLTPEGDAIVNDPAHIEVGDGIVYNAEELARAWIERGGVAYIIGPPREVASPTEG